LTTKLNKRESPISPVIAGTGKAKVDCYALVTGWLLAAYMSVGVAEALSAGPFKRARLILNDFNDFNNFNDWDIPWDESRKAFVYWDELRVGGRGRKGRKSRLGEYQDDCSTDSSYQWKDFRTS
jgi:hypothetical protein